MKPNKITLDADDVLINSVVQLNNFHNHKYGTDFCLDDYISFHLHETWGITPDQVYKDECLFYQSEFHNKIEIVEGAYESIEYLSKNYDLHVMTGRCIDFEAYLQATLSELFESHHFCYSSPWRKKSHYGYSEMAEVQRK
jgi:hypothetical protein